MNNKPIARRFLVPMVAVALVLTVALAVVLGSARVVEKLGDASGAGVLDAVALALGLIWLVDVICLVLALGVNSLDPPSPPDEME